MDIQNFFWKRGKKREQVEALVIEVERAEQPESQRAAAVTPRSQRSENTTPPCGSRFHCETSVKQQDFYQNREDENMWFSVMALWDS
jgi:hypothetical protein